MEISFRHIARAPSGLQTNRVLPEVLQTELVALFNGDAAGWIGTERTPPHSNSE